MGDNATTKASPAAVSEDWEVQRDANKSLGDAAFRSGNYAEAISHYTQALSLDPTHAILLSNRSAAYLKNGEKSKALHDAQDCTRSNPDFAKGHSRLAAALQSLTRWGPAKEAYEKVLELDKDNAVAKKGLEDCMARLKEQEELNKEAEQKVDEEEKSEEKDLLDDFFDEVETVSTKKPKKEPEATNIIKGEKTDLGTPESQIGRLLAPNYKWRNLNPFFVLDMSHRSSVDDISRRYKALSLLLHPDKCGSIPNAKEAYDEVQRAKAQLDDENKSRHVRQLVEEGLRKGKQLCKPGEKVKDAQTREVQRIFAEIEYKRREVEDRQRKQEQREREQEEEELNKEKKSREFEKNWREDTRVEKRVGSWRGFQQKKPAKKKKV